MTALPVVTPAPIYWRAFPQEFKQLYDMPNPYAQKPGGGGLDSARKSNGESSRPKQVLISCQSCALLY